MEPVKTRAFGHNFVQKDETPVSGFRIEGGKDASEKDMPFPVSIQRRQHSGGQDFEHFCGGSIIDNEYVLTAAHCVKGRSVSDLRVVAGVLDISENSSEETKVVREVTEVYVHEEFDYDTRRHDIAILKVSPAFPTDNPAVKAIELRKEAARDGTICTVSGWGYIDETTKNQDG